MDWEGADRDRAAAIAAAKELAEFHTAIEGEPLVVGNEFSEVRMCKVRTRNGARVLVESTKTGQWVTLDPLELEAITWQNTVTFSAMVGRPFGPLLSEETE